VYLVYVGLSSISVLTSEMLTRNASNGGCSGPSYDNQVDENLSDGGGQFNDAISSYYCKVN
jgi:hypothetical protein